VVRSKGFTPESIGEPFAARAVTPTDVLDYKAHLRTVQRRQAATVNRRLAALRKFFLWAQATGRIAELPTVTVKGVRRSPRVPKSLPKRDVDRLIREAQKAGNKRNLAIVYLLRHTGVRVAELCALRLSDIRTSERKGQVLVRSGKGDKDRTVPLNHDVREALEAYLAVAPLLRTAWLRRLVKQMVSVTRKDRDRCAGSMSRGPASPCSRLWPSMSPIPISSRRSYRPWIALT
jgi:site-specific recombinase XerD